MDMVAIITKVCKSNGLVFAFMLIGIITLITYKLSALTKGKIHGALLLLFLPGLFWLILVELVLVVLKG